MKTLNHSSGKLITMADAAYYYSVRGASYGETDTIVETSSSITTLDAYGIAGGYYILPDGEDNKFGYQLMQLLEDNNLGMGVLLRQRGLQYGQGLGMYKVEFVDGRRQVTWFEPDKKIAEWLKQWDHEEYLMNVLLDLVVKREFYSKVYRNRAPRIKGGKAVPAALEHVGFADCRKEWPDDKGNFQNFFVADWRDGEPDYLLRYPKFDPLKPLTREVYMMQTAFYEPGRNARMFSIPSYYGARKWMQRSNIAPDILKAQSDNGMNIKWHIISPQSYWDNKRKILEKQCEQKKVQYKEDMLEDLKDAILTGLSDVLAGINNVGKFFHSEAVQMQLGVGKSEVMKWEVIPIDMKVKEFTESQIEISKYSHSAITSSMGLHPSLANILVDGKLASGSELLYAFKLFLATETQTIQKKALEPLNLIRQLYFPKVEGQFGFYHDIVKREEDITSSERITNNDE